MRIILAVIFTVLFCGVSFADDIFIQIRYDYNTEYGIFSDSLFYSQSEYEKITQDDIDLEKKIRASKFIDQVKNPKLFIPPKEEALVLLKEKYLEEITQKQQEIISIDNEILEAKEIAKDKDSPNQPRNLEILKFSDDIIVLGWDPSSDAKTHVVGYKIYKNGEIFASTTESTFYDTKFIPKESYTYAVSAIDKAGNESVLSNEINYPKDKD